MSGPVKEVARKVPNDCQVTQCNKDRCKLRLDGAPTARIVIDLDCRDLSIPQHQKRCDYVFVGEEGNTAWVSPIELKSGRFSASGALEQLKGGIAVADNWLPQVIIALQFVPVLAHGKPIHKEDRRRLLSSTLKLRGKTSKAMLLKCGDRLTKALLASPQS